MVTASGESCDLNVNYSRLRRPLRSREFGSSRDPVQYDYPDAWKAYMSSEVLGEFIKRTIQQNPFLVPFPVCTSIRVHGRQDYVPASHGGMFPTWRTEEGYLISKSM